jgi:hypothetical protein
MSMIAMRAVALLLPGLGFSSLAAMFWLLSRRAVQRTRPGASPAWARRLVLACSIYLGLVGVLLTLLGLIVVMIT